MVADEYFDDLGIAYREEIKELYDNGCSKFLGCFEGESAEAAQNHVQEIFR